MDNQNEKIVIDKKEANRIKSKKYYDKNIEKRKLYVDVNKDKIKNYREQDYICPCGATVQLCHKPEHNRSKKHQEFLKIDEPLINLIPINECNNKFRIKCKLPNGETIDIRKCFNFTNKAQIRATMDDIRQDLINEHYPDRI